MGVLGSGPLSGVGVLLTYPDGSQAGADTDAGGNVSFKLKAQGGYTLKITPPDNTHGELDVSATVRGAATITAVLSKTPPTPPTTFALSVAISPESGGTTSPSGTNTYNSGTVVSVTATPASGYAFDHWELDGVDKGSANPISVTMDANHLLVAFFAVITSPFVQSNFGAPTVPLSNPTLNEPTVSFA